MITIRVNKSVVLFALLSLVLILSVGWGAAQEETDTIYYACVNNSSGTIKVWQQPQPCASNEFAIEWNSEGPPGEPGAPGEPGPPGEPGNLSLAGKSCMAGYVVGFDDQGDLICSAEPAPELCDGVDNDLDTQIDEDFPNLSTPCTVGIGSCLNSGAYVCSYDGTGTMCSVTPLPPTVEVCDDGLDNDCDGLTDAADPSCVTEACDGLDNDGDGEYDEDFPNLGAFCTSGNVGSCYTTGNYVCTQDGAGTACNAPVVLPSWETCGDGLDNDCDGSIDEGCSGG